MIEVVDLHKYFGSLQVLNGITTKVDEGEVVCIVGPSGSGKSTFLRCLSLLEEPTKGDIIVDGQKINEKGVDLNKVREKLGMVFQNFNLFPHMTTFRNITFAPVQTGRMSKADAESKAKELLTRVGLSDKTDVYPTALSGGQKQRLCIARALLRRPKVLILDDSTSAVDTKTDSLIRAGLKDYLPDTTKIIIAQRTSSIEESDKIIVLDNGRINAIGTHEELLKDNPIYREVYFSQNKQSVDENQSQEGEVTSHE